MMIIISLLLLLMLVAASSAANTNNNLRARADPDTTCTQAYRNDPSSCLHTTDHYGRPCQLCNSGNDTFCYNADEARWAKIFGASCETSPDATTTIVASSDTSTRMNKLVADNGNFF